MAKLLLVIPTLSSYDAFLSDFAEAAIAEGHEVHVATCLQRLIGCGALETEVTCVKFHNIDFARGANPLMLCKAIRQLRVAVNRIEPDWIQAHFSVAALVAALARTKTWPYTSCIIQGLACTLARGYARYFAWMGERFAMLRLDTMWVLSQDDLEVVKRWNIKKARIQKAPGFGCRLERFDSTNYSYEERTERRSQLGITGQDTVIIFVGRLVSFKGFDRTVRAFNQLCARGLSVRLLVLGTFDVQHSSGLSGTERKELDTNNRVIMAGWQANVADWLAIADICVFPSEREGMPVCLMESLAMGVPVITRDSRGSRDVVSHEIDGIVLNNASASRLAKAIEEVVSNETLLKSMADAAIKNRAHFDRRHYINEQLNELSKVLNFD